LHHADPFERLIIAQTLVGEYAVVTSEVNFESYRVKVIW
jgi:PIN domain nuclease of toxin-antitoxin system